MPLNVFVAGARGLIGTAVCTALEQRGDTVTRIVSTKPKRRDLSWDAIYSRTLTRLENADVVINLAGHNIGERRWTEAERERIWDSRIVTSEALAEAVATLKHPPQTLINASAVGYYGDRGDDLIDESAPRGKGFLPMLCEKWEEMTKPASDAGIRTVHLRTGVVLANEGGALPRQAMLYRMCLGGRIGSGDQWMSWIHLHDVVRAILHIVDHDSLSGAVNVSSPRPIQQIDQNVALGSLLHRPTWFPVAPWMLKLTLGKGFTREMMLASTRVTPTKLLGDGFNFEHTNYTDAVGALLYPNDVERITSARDAVALFQLNRMNDNRMNERRDTT